MENFQFKPSSFIAGKKLSTKRIPSFKDRILAGHRILAKAENDIDKMVGDLDSYMPSVLKVDPKLESLRWFLLPSEAKMALEAESSTNRNFPPFSRKEPVFNPKTYPPALLSSNSSFQNKIENCSIIPN